MEKKEIADSINIKIMGAVVDYVIANGTQHTSNGGWITYFDSIPIAIATPDFVKNNAEEIGDMLAVREEVLDIEIYNDNFDIVYGLAYCPDLQDDEDVAMYKQAQLEKKELC